MIIFAAYRDWAKLVYEALVCDKILVTNNKELMYQIELNDGEIQALIFVGWSEIIPDCIIKKYLCVCYHPSDLPKYRGGSPLQHQIIDGIEITKGSLFLMNSRLDSGPIFMKHELSLLGDMSCILKNLTANSLHLVQCFIETLKSGREITYTEQIESEATYFKRRSPEMSEISIDELLMNTGLQIYNKIRALGDPYPNAFIKTRDGRILIIKNAELQ